MDPASGGGTTVGVVVVVDGGGCWNSCASGDHKFCIPRSNS